MKKRTGMMFAALLMLLLAVVCVPAGAETTSPFYGIWCHGCKDMSEAQYYAGQMRGYGFDAQVYTTTDWSNLNPEKWYCVTCGIYASAEAANAALPSVLSVYGDAYVKYSGDYKGSGSSGTGSATHTDLSRAGSTAAPSGELYLWDGVILLVYNCSEYITLRMAPSYDAQVLLNIPKDAEVIFHGNAGGGFYEVEYDGVRGYAGSKYLRPVILSVVDHPVAVDAFLSGLVNPNAIAEHPDGYACFDMDADGIGELILRLYDPDFQEGGKYVYYIYKFNEAKNTYESMDCDIISYVGGSSLKFDLENHLLIVDWTYGPDYSFARFTTDGSVWTLLDEIRENRIYPEVCFMSLNTADVQAEEPKPVNEAQAPVNKELSAFCGEFETDRGLGLDLLMTSSGELYMLTGYVQHNDGVHADGAMTGIMSWEISSYEIQGENLLIEASAYSHRGSLSCALLEDGALYITVLDGDFSGGYYFRR